VADKSKPPKGTKDKQGPFAGLRDLKERLAKEEAAKRDQAKSPAAKKARGGAASGRSTAGEPAAGPARSKRADPNEDAGPKRSATEDDDALLLHRLYAGVEPLDRSRGGRLPKQAVERSSASEGKRVREAAQAEAAEVHDRLRGLVEGRARFEVADDGHHVEGRREDVPMEAVRRLRRGLLPVDGRLDLHGMGAAEARAQLELFLRTMRARGERCVLVIHGKGEHSPGGVGVLRGEIAAWLSQGASSEHVAAFATASDPDGGEGATYVLVRR
jgi:DNA-nicking Smr family endonuclease